MRDTKRFAFELDSLTLAAHLEKYKPREGLNYVAFTFHATAPEVNMKGMAITPPTMKASFMSAIHTGVDFEHRIDDIPIPQNDGFESEIMGHIVEMNMGDIPDADDDEAWILSPFIPKEPIITSGVMALFTRVWKIGRIADEVSRGASWFFSLEIGENTTEPAIWLAGTDELPHEIIPWGEATEELRQVASQPKMMEHEGRAVAYVMGGADGVIPFVGGAITSNPAGFEQRQPLRSLQLIASADGAIQDSFSERIWKSESWKKSIQASLKNRKEASNSDGDVGGTISPVLVNDLEELIEVTDVVTELIGKNDEEDSGGEEQVAKIEIEQDDLDKRIADARTEGKTEGDGEGYTRGMDEGKTAGVTEAVEGGTHIPADQVDGIVAKRVMSKARADKVASLPCDEDTKADFLDIASNEDKYPLDADGETKFAEAYGRWEKSMTTASDDGGDGDDDDDDGEEEGKKKKKTASDDQGKKKTFDLGDGSSDDDAVTLDSLLAE